MTTNEILSLDTELSIEERNSIILPLFGIEWIKSEYPNGDISWEAYDEDGDIVSTNLKTLRGIIEYACEMARHKERNKFQSELRKLAGL